MSNSCRIVKVGAVTAVFNEDGTRNELFQQALEYYNGNVEQAMDVWNIFNSEEFEASGLKTPTVEQVLSFASSFPQTFEETKTLSGREVVEVVEMAENNGFSSLNEFRDKLNSIFKPKGFFEMNTKEAVKAGLYTVEEAEAINPNTLFNALNRLDKHIDAYGDIEITNPKYSGIKNTSRPKNMFGSYPSVTETEVVQFVLDNGADALVDSEYSFVSQNISDGILGATRAKNQENAKPKFKLTPQDILDRLNKTGLANKVHILSPKEMDDKLVGLGVDAKLAKQIIGRDGAKNLDNTSIGIINRLDNLSLAEQMEKQGKTPQQIKFATGWERGGEFISLFKNRTDDEVITFLETQGVKGNKEEILKLIKEDELYFQKYFGVYNGEWRYEVDYGDVNLGNLDFKDSHEDFNENVSVLKLSDVLSNTDVFVAYPHLKDTNVIVYNPTEETPNIIRNSFGYISGNNIYLNYEKINRTINEGAEAVSTSEIIRHELQHLIQSSEGFEEGTTTIAVEKEVIDALIKREQGKKLIGNEIAISQIFDFFYKNKDLTLDEVIDRVVFNIYNNSVGEIEARNVEKRIKDGSLLRSTENVDRLLQHKLLQFQTPGLNITPNGFVYNGEVFFNEEKINDSSLLVHEFNHLYTGLLKQTNRPLYERGLRLVEQEGQEYIDFVKQNQPNLEGEALLEEALTQSVGEQGARIIDETRRNKFVQFLADVWASIKNQLGLSAYSNSQVQKMNLKEYVNAMAVDLLSGERLVQEKRTADKLPLTLSVFNRPEFEKMKGKMVNPITILNSLNQQGIKQIEKDLIKSVIEENYQGQKKVSYDELELKVRVSLMPLERISTSSYANYGMDNLGDGNYGKANTIILNSPIEHGVTGHFSGDFKASGRKNIKYVPKQLNDNVWVAVEEGYESQASDNNIYQFVGTAGTKEAVDAWIVKYNLSQGKIFDDKKYLVYQDAYDQVDNVLPVAGFDTEQEAKDYIERNRDDYAYNLDYVDEQYLKDKWNLEETNKGMFGHIRVWQDGQDFYVAELQSDFFQKNNARKEILEKNQDYKNAKFEYDTELKDTQLKKDLFFTDYQNLFLTELEKLDNVEVKPHKLVLYDGTVSDEEYLWLFVNGEPMYKSNYQTNSSYSEEMQRTTILKGKNLKGLSDELGEELLRSIDDKVREPIKPLEKEIKTAQKKFDNTIENIIKNLPKDQKQFIASQKEWEKRLLREALKEAALSGATTFRLPTPYTLSVIEGYLEPSKLQGAELGGVVDYLDREYVVVDDTGEEITIIPLSNMTRVSIEDFENMQSDGTIEDDVDIYEYYLGDTGYGVKDVNEEYFYYNNSYRPDGLEKISSKDTENKGKNNFTIEDSLDDTQQTVARKYEEIAEILKKERGDNFEVVTDENGFDWYETKITPSEVDKPVIAFQIKSATSNTGTYSNRNNDIRFQIIGEQGARNLDKARESTRLLDNLAIARQMELGKTPQEIRLTTGWEKGNDGNWKYEIQDGVLKGDIKFESMGSIEGLSDEVMDVVLKDIYDNEELYNTYPELAETEVFIYKPIKNTVYANVDAMEIQGKIFLNYDKTIKLQGNRHQKNNSTSSTITHELQHLIQRREGFSTGSNSYLAENTIRNTQRKIENNETLNAEELKIKELIDGRDLNNPIDMHYISTQVYKRAGGEVEARNVESRLNMTPEQRRETLLQETEDVAREDQIIILDGFEGDYNAKQSEDVVSYSTIPNGRGISHTFNLGGENIASIRTLPIENGEIIEGVIVKEDYQGQGIGTELYLETIRNLMIDKKVLRSDKAQTTYAKRIWDGLVNLGVAVKISDSQYESIPAPFNVTPTTSIDTVIDFLSQPPTEMYVFEDVTKDVSNRAESDKFGINIEDEASSYRQIPTLMLDGEVFTTENIYPYVELKNTIIPSSNPTFNVDANLLLNLDEDVWLSRRKEVKSVLKGIEKTLISNNIDVIGISELETSREVVSEFLVAIQNVLSLPNDTNLRTLANLKSEYINSDMKVFTKDLPSKYNNLTVVNVESNLSQDELFEMEGLVKIHTDNMYQKVEVLPIDELYDEMYSRFLKGEVNIPQNFFPRDMDLHDVVNEERVREGIQNYIRSRNVGFDSVNHEAISVYQVLFNHDPIPQRLPNIESLQTNAEYLKTGFVTDFYNFILQEKFNNTDLYNSTLKYFKVTDSDLSFHGIDLNIKGMKYEQELRDYAQVKKDSGKLGELLANTEVEFNEDLEVLNNPNSVTNTPNYTQIDKGLYVTNQSPENYIRVDSGVARMVGQMFEDTIYQDVNIIKGSNIYYDTNLNFDVNTDVISKKYLVWKQANNVGLQQVNVEQILDNIKTPNNITENTLQQASDFGITIVPTSKAVREKYDECGV